MRGRDGCVAHQLLTQAPQAAARFQIICLGLRSRVLEAIEIATANTFELGSDHERQHRRHAVAIVLRV